DAGGLLREENDLVLRFHALGPLLAARRPRPNWRPGRVPPQRLRWHRTSLLGRIPAWCPPVAPVGPWRPVLLEPASPLRVERADVRAVLHGDTGAARVAVLALGPASDVVRGGTLAVGEWLAPLALEHVAAGEVALNATVRV